MRARRPASHPSTRLHSRPRDNPSHNARAHRNSAAAPPQLWQSARSSRCHFLSGTRQQSPPLPAHAAYSGYMFFHPARSFSQRRTDSVQTGHPGNTMLLAGILRSSASVRPEFAYTPRRQRRGTPLLLLHLARSACNLLPSSCSTAFPAAGFSHTHRGWAPRFPAALSAYRACSTQTISCPSQCAPAFLHSCRVPEIHRPGSLSVRNCFHRPPAIDCLRTPPASKHAGNMSARYRNRHA